MSRLCIFHYPSASPPLLLSQTQGDASRRGAPSPAAYTRKLGRRLLKDGSSEREHRVTSRGQRKKKESVSRWNSPSVFRSATKLDDGAAGVAGGHEEEVEEEEEESEEEEVEEDTEEEQDREEEKESEDEHIGKEDSEDDERGKNNMYDEELRRDILCTAP